MPSLYTVHSPGKNFQVVSGRSNLFSGISGEEGWSVEAGLSVLVFLPSGVYITSTLLTILVNSPVYRVLQGSSASQVKPWRLLSKSESLGLLGLAYGPPPGSPVSTWGHGANLFRHWGSTALHQRLMIFHHMLWQWGWNNHSWNWCNRMEGAGNTGS